MRTFPLISLIVVSNKPRFAEAVRRSYEFQTYPNKELVVVDSSEDGNLLRDVADTYVRGPVGGNVGPLRNIGLQVARGEWFMWFDDDDWRHPELVSVLMHHAVAGEDWCLGLRHRCWINLEGTMERQGCPAWPVFGASVFRNAPDLPRFRPFPEIKTDSWWMVRMRTTQGPDGMGVLSRPYLYAWVFHGDNLSNVEYEVGKSILTEDDERFFPGEPCGLRAHMNLLRAAL